MAALFQLLGGVAAFVNAGGHVQAVGVQLVVGRRPLGAAQRGAPAPARIGRTDRRDQAERQAGRREVALVGRAEARVGNNGGGAGSGVCSIAVGAHPHLFEPHTRAQSGAPGQAQRLQGEQRIAAGLGAGHEGLVAQRREIQPLGLQTRHAAPGAQRQHHRGLGGLQPQLAAAAGEGGADGAAAFHLLVLVAGVAGLQRQRRERPVQAAALTAQLQPVALHADGDVGFDGDAVVVSVGVQRRAQVAAGIGPGGAHSDRLALAGAVGDLPGVGQRLALGDRREARRAQVLALAVGGVEVPVQAVGTALQQSGRGPLAGAAAQPQLGSSAQALQRLARDAVVQCVDHATGGVAAVQQRGRAAQHLDALDHQRIERHRVVEAQVGRVGRRAAVVEQADAVAVEPPDHRPTGLRAEIAGRHPRLTAERLAQRAGAAQRQRVAAEHGAGLGQRCAAQRVAGDDHRGGGRWGGGRGGGRGVRR